MNMNGYIACSTYNTNGEPYTGKRPFYKAEKDDEITRDYFVLQRMPYNLQEKQKSK